MVERNRPGPTPQELRRTTAIQVVARQEPHKVRIGEHEETMYYDEARALLRAEAPKVRAEYEELQAQFRKALEEPGKEQEVGTLRMRLRQYEIVDTRVAGIGISSHE